MRTVCWGQASDHSQQPESWNEVDVDDSADKAEIRRQVLHDGSFADSPELRLLSEGGAWRKWENCQTLPPGNLKVKVIPQQPGTPIFTSMYVLHAYTLRLYMFSASIVSTDSKLASSNSQSYLWLERTTFLTWP